jgi:hypothetical protein
MNKLIIQLNILSITSLGVLVVWYFSLFDNIAWGMQIFIFTLIIYFIEFIVILLKQYEGKNFVFLSLILAIIYYILSIYLPALRLGIWTNVIVTILYILVNGIIAYKVASSRI